MDTIDKNALLDYTAEEAGTGAYRLRDGINHGFIGYNL